MVSYCPTCNKELDEEVELCPECGSSTADQITVNANNNKDIGVEISIPEKDQDMGTKLKAVFLFGALWTIVFLHEGVQLIKQGIAYLYVGSGSMFGEYYVIQAEVAIVSGVFTLMSGILILLSCMYIFKLEQYRKASRYYLIGFIFAAISGIAVWCIMYIHYQSELLEALIPLCMAGYSFFVGIFGIIFYILLKREKNRFHS